MSIFWHNSLKNPISEFYFTPNTGWRHQLQKAIKYFFSSTILCKTFCPKNTPSNASIPKTASTPILGPSTMVSRNFQQNRMIATLFMLISVQHPQKTSSASGRAHRKACATDRPSRPKLATDQGEKGCQYKHLGCTFAMQLQFLTTSTPCAQQKLPKKREIF